jgi:hypothetical protein
MENLSSIWPLLLFFLLFPLFWMGVIFLVAYISGWTALAKVYHFDGAFQGRRWSFQSAQVGWGNYNGVLTVGANWEGLYLKPFFLFQFGHTPLFIPWYDISTKQTGSIFKSVEFHFQRVPSVRLKLSLKLSRHLAEVAGDAWPHESTPPTGQ